MTEPTIEGIAKKAARKIDREIKGAVDEYLEAPDETVVKILAKPILAAIVEATEAQRKEIERLKGVLKVIEKGLPVYYGDKPFTVTHEQVNKKLMDIARKAQEKT